MRTSGSRALTERQRECLRLAANGFTNEQIARGLRVSQSVVREHLWTAYCRLGIWGHTSRLRAAIRLLDEEFPKWRY